MTKAENETNQNTRQDDTMRNLNNKHGTVSLYAFRMDRSARTVIAVQFKSLFSLKPDSIIPDLENTIFDFFPLQSCPSIRQVRTTTVQQMHVLSIQYNIYYVYYSRKTVIWLCIILQYYKVRRNILGEERAELSRTSGRPWTVDYIYM